MKTNIQHILKAILLFGLLATSLHAELDEATVKKLNSLKYLSGKVVLGENLANLKIPSKFQFLGSQDARFVMEQLWNNPKDENTLGLLMHKGDNPFTEKKRYVVEISYSEDGHVSDEDAKNLNYDDLMKDMMESSEAANKQRAREGFAKVDLLGWADKPWYDNVGKKLHWAKKLHFEGEENPTINYNIRILGRKGVLVLNILADEHEMEDLKKDQKNLLAAVSFIEGNRYSDYNPSLDKLAAYGIGGLIAGKILAKAGLFVLLAKVWKILALAAIAVGGWFIKRKKTKSASAKVD